MEVLCGIYRIHNCINNKDYIGQAQDIYARWKNHKHCNDNCPIHLAMNKYGEENFEFSILELCSIPQLDEKEQYWIAYYDSYNTGYNATTGGHRPTHTNCDRAIEMYDLEGNFIKTFNSLASAARELKCEISLISSVIQKRRPTAKGYQFKAVDDNKTIITKFNKKKSGPSGKKIVQMDLSNNIIAIYPSISEAARQTGLHNQNIGGVCRGIKQTCGGYKWKFAESEI